VQPISNEFKRGTTRIVHSIFRSTVELDDRSTDFGFSGSFAFETSAKQQVVVFNLDTELIKSDSRLTHHFAKTWNQIFSVEIRWPF